MGFITPNDYDNLRALYTGQLRYLLSTENQSLKGLDTMISHTQDEQLKQAFQSHKQESQVQAQRLEQIITAQKIEHYEIASYGAARDWAKTLGLQQHVDLLQKTLDEEKHFDLLLNSISERTNADAATAAA